MFPYQYVLCIITMYWRQRRRRWWTDDDEQTWLNDIYWCTYDDEILDDDDIKEKQSDHLIDVFTNDDVLYLSMTYFNDVFSMTFR